MKKSFISLMWICFENSCKKNLFLNMFRNLIGPDEHKRNVFSSHEYFFIFLNCLLRVKWTWNYPRWAIFFKELFLAKRDKKSGREIRYIYTTVKIVFSISSYFCREKNFFTFFSYRIVIKLSQEKNFPTRRREI